MLLKRLYHDGLAYASYLVDCQKTGEALVMGARLLLSAKGGESFAASKRAGLLVERGDDALTVAR